MSRFMKAELEKMEAYVPGEQPQDKKYIKLNTNESPYPPSQKVIDAINAKQVENLRLYSDPTAKKLSQAVANLYKVECDNVFLSNGSDEILNFAFMSWGTNGVAFCDITYGFYEVFASLYNLDAQIIPLRPDFTIDVDAFVGINKMVVIANPNAPTGMQIPLSDIEKIASSNPNNVVVIDEAYVDFGGQSALPLIDKYDNLLIVRTYSKSRSMAGARLGYAFASKPLIADLEKIKYSTNPYNVNRLTQIAGIATIEDDEYYVNNCNKIIETREYTTCQLQSMGFTVLPSFANFIFCKSDKMSGKELYEKLKDNGILVRYFSKERINQWCRVSIGSKQEMEQFVTTVRTILEQ